MDIPKYKAKIYKQDKWIEGYPIKWGEKYFMVSEQYGFHVAKLSYRHGLYECYGKLVKIDPKTLKEVKDVTK